MTTNAFKHGSLLFTLNVLWAGMADRMTAFKRGQALATSLGRQKRLLDASRRLLAAGDLLGSRLEFDAWKIERAFYCHLLAAQGLPLAIAA